MNRHGWTRWGLVLLVGIAVGCSSGQSLPTGSDSTQSARIGTGYQVQQGNLKPGRPGTRQRQEYCRRWQCAFVAREDRNWCMRGCMTTWDLE